MNNTFDAWEGEHLEHYGIPGMKWGERRFQNKDGSLTTRGKKHYAQTGEYGYTYKSHATKKYDRKAAKATAKGNTEKAAKFKQRADISRQIDAREHAYAKSVKAGGNIAARLLTNTIGRKGYQQHMAMNSKNRSTSNKAVSAALQYLGGSALSRLRKAAVIRSNENTKMGSLGRNVGGNNFEYKNKKAYAANGGPSVDQRIREASIAAAEKYKKKKR